MTTQRHGARLDLSRIDGALFDMDGVITRTMRVHRAAWKQLFDEYLEHRARAAGETFVPFEAERDYLEYVDGKPRYEGVRSFLASRDIELPYGDPSDSLDAETVCGLGNRKNRYFRERLAADGVDVYDAAVDCIRTLRAHDVKVAVVTSSKNCRAVLEQAGLTALFDAQVDGVVIEELGLTGKPDPDMFLEASRRLGVPPARAVVFEDAISGVQAGRRGGFAMVVGVDRAGQADALRHNGADIVITNFRELDVVARETSSGDAQNGLPSAIHHWPELERRMAGKQVAIFLDYDGTLTPIVDRPDLAIMSDDMRAAVQRLARCCTVAVISGRDRQDVEDLVKVSGIFYAGSHGFDIRGPQGETFQNDAVADIPELVQRVAEELRRRLGGVDGCIIEPKRYAVAVHYRLVSDEDLATVERHVDEVVAAHPKLKKAGGKKVHELRPDIDWDKGKALLWLLRALDLDTGGVLPFYLGDDLTDEDAFAVLDGRGIGILVAETPQQTRASFGLHDPEEVRDFLGTMADRLEGEAAG